MLTYNSGTSYFCQSVLFEQKKPILKMLILKDEHHFNNDNF